MAQNLVEPNKRLSLALKVVVFLIWITPGVMLSALFWWSQSERDRKIPSEVMPLTDMALYFCSESGD